MCLTKEMDVWKSDAVRGNLINEVGKYADRGTFGTWICVFYDNGIYGCLGNLMLFMGII